MSEAPLAEVIGDPIAQSKSPRIHRFWLEKLGLAGDYRAHRVLTGQVPAFLDAALADPAWRGCNVTMPHKHAALAAATRADPVAARIGAANTLVREGDALVACNTDAPGFLEPLRGDLAQTHFFRMARILGTGGAARAIVVALADEGFTLVLAGRDPAKARAMLDELAPGGEHHAVALEHFAAPTDFAFDDREGCLDLIVNASPLGMRGQPPLAFDFSHAPPRSVVYDIVTDPVETDFLKRARAAGFRTINGLAMLIGQAAHAFEKFYGQPPPREHDRELEGLLTR
ncbi:MAG: shikimate dehydrogenase [Erythrobacter sp.]|jgi:shikimate dehydrogenase|nr:shikimate dehydrogenase [Erythrobacter sp.]